MFNYEINLMTGNGLYETEANVSTKRILANNFTQKRVSLYCANLDKIWFIIYDVYAIYMQLFS